MHTFRSLAPASRLASLLLLTGAALGLARPASAQQFKVTATGTVTYIEDSAHLYNSSVAIGTPFTFSYLFDYSAVDTDSADPNRGVYQLSGTSSGATISVGDYKFAPSAASVNYVVVNRRNGQDAFEFVSTKETATGFSSPRTAAAAKILIFNPLGQFLASDALPPLSAYSKVNLAATNYTQFDVSVLNGNGDYSTIIS